MGELGYGLGVATGAAPGAAPSNEQTNAASNCKRYVDRSGVVWIPPEAVDIHLRIAAVTNRCTQGHSL